ncbi:MAG: cytochrome b [Anaerolineaceae bacterium]|nr:MAG: cytochrome b [Anaerolineaceae bacterium]
MSTENPKRYHPVHVVLHWLMAVMTILAIVIGMFVLNPIPDTAEKTSTLQIHALWGGLLALVLVARLITRFTLPRPASANTDSTFLDFVSKAVHFLLYVGVIGMVVSGLGTAVQADLFAVFRGAVPFPADFMAYPPRLGHGFTALALLGLIGLHVAAALYHQFIKKDNLLARMWFGKR